MTTWGPLAAPITGKLATLVSVTPRAIRIGKKHAGSP